jgi:mRNA interferase MazF
MLDYIFAVVEWCKVVIFLRGKDKKVLFKEGEIWWCSIGMNVGVEVYGKGRKFERPVLIYKKLDGNSFLALPLTSKIKKGTWYIGIDSGGVNGSVLLAQARALDARRLIKKIGTLGVEDFENVQSHFLQLYGQDAPSINIDPAKVTGDSLSPATELENGGLPQT